jgi:4'-phosphopantetheinyl transferase
MVEDASHLLEGTNSSPSWPPPPERLSLTAADVHIWRASLEQLPEEVAKLRQLLSSDEQARADRFHFEKDRRHFTVARGVLRRLLSHYLGRAATEIQFSYADRGKPRLASDLDQRLKFNVAHSGGLALFAFTNIGEIGVDIEQIRPEVTSGDIAKRFFSASEVAALEELPALGRQQAFFDCWTRKESFIKAKGLGLSLALDQFDVTMGPDEPAALLSTRWDQEEAARWSLRALDVGPGFVGAVALEAHDWQLSCWEFAV